MHSSLHQSRSSHDLGDARRCGRKHRGARSVTATATRPLIRAPFMAEQNYLRYMIMGHEPFKDLECEYYSHFTRDTLILQAK